jgi:hypothetical protein
MISGRNVLEISGSSIPQILVSAVSQFSVNSTHQIHFAFIHALKEPKLNDIFPSTTGKTSCAERDEIRARTF